MVSGVCRTQHRGMKPPTFAAMIPVLSLSIAAAAPTEVKNQSTTDMETPSVTLLVYDFSKLRQTELHSWKKEVAHILGAAAIRVDWVSCGSGTEYTNTDRCGHAQPGDLFLRLLDGRTVKGPGLALGYLGLAEPGWGGRGRLTVMVNNVKELCGGTLWQFPDLLAHATVHEIGHLSGILEHSPSGVMRADWRKSTIKQMTHAALVFSADEAARMRDALRVRLAESRPSSIRLPDRY